MNRFDRYQSGDSMSRRTPNEINVRTEEIGNIPVKGSFSTAAKVIMVLTSIGMVIGIAAAVGLPLYFSLTRSTNDTSTTRSMMTTTSATTVTTTSATTTTTTSTTSRTTTTTTTTTTATTTTTTTTTTRTTTTTTSTSTTTSVTTTSTTAIIVTGTQNYASEITGNGYHGVQKFRYYTATNTGSAMRYGYPIVYLSGTTFSGSYTNNAWYALHAGCGNSNGIASCTAVCKSYNKTYVGITGTCGSGYAGSVTTYTNPDRAVYTGTDSNSAPWNDYGTASGCGNPMYYCDCSL